MMKLSRNVLKFSVTNFPSNYFPPQKIKIFFTTVKKYSLLSKREYRCTTTLFSW